MGIHQWGKTVAGALLTAAVITAVSGCGGEADADAKKPPAKAQALSVDKAHHELSRRRHEVRSGRRLPEGSRGVLEADDRGH